MQCQQVEEVIDAYVDHRLEADAQAQVAEHAKSCDTCRQKIQTATQSVQMLREALGWVTPGEEFDGKITSRVIYLHTSSKAGMAAPKPPPQPEVAEIPDLAEQRRLVLLALGAALAFLLAVAAVTWTLMGREKPAGPPAPTRGP